MQDSQVQKEEQIQVQTAQQDQEHTLLVVAVAPARQEDTLH
jgi:hypothetical protein